MYLFALFYCIVLFVDTVWISNKFVDRVNYNIKRRNWPAKGLLQNDTLIGALVFFITLDFLDFIVLVSKESRRLKIVIRSNGIDLHIAAICWLLRIQKLRFISYKLPAKLSVEGFFASTPSDDAASRHLSPSMSICKACLKLTICVGS